MKHLSKIQMLSLLITTGLFFTHPVCVFAQTETDEQGDILDTTFDRSNEQPTSESPIEEVPSELVVDQVQLEAVEAPAASSEPTTPLPAATSENDDTFVLTNQDGSVEVITTPRHSGTYFDASSIGTPELTNSPAPREVDPRYEPGSSFVVVTKSAGASSMPARMVAAQRALKLGRYSSALELYEQLYKDNPKSHRVLMGLAVAQQKSGFTESAIATYEELLKHEPNNADAMANMLGLIKTQYPAVAYRRLQDLWQKNPTNAYISSELGLISASVDEFQEAIRYMGIASSLEPDNASHYYNMAVVYDRANETEKAIELYQKALEVDITFGGGRSIAREQIYDRLAYLRRL